MKRSEFDKLNVGDTVYVVKFDKINGPSITEGTLRDKTVVDSSVGIHYFLGVKNSHPRSMMVGISALMNKADAEAKYARLKAEFDKLEAERDERMAVYEEFTNFVSSVEKPFRKSGVSVTVDKETGAYHRKDKSAALFNVAVTAEELQRVVEFVQSIRSNA